MSEQFSRSRREVIKKGAFALLLGVLPCVRASDEFKPRIIAIRSWPSDEYTRVTIESDVEIRFTYFSVQDPERLVIDIRNTVLNDVLRSLSTKTIDDPYIKQARAGQFRPDVVRVVLDLKSPVRPNIFSLKPFDRYKNRLVIDLYPPADPISALLKGFENNPLDSLPGGSEVRTAKDTKTPAATNRASNLNISRVNATVTIDPGHGGEDPGAIGRRGTKEKDIVLAIALLLQSRFRNHRNIRIEMTRNKDIFIPLGLRVAKSRATKSDFFISIHADAFIQPNARGSSVFILSESGASSTAANWLAKTQNESDLIGGTQITTRDEYLARTLLDLTQTATLSASNRLAKTILKNFAKINRLHKNYVEKAGFAVLKAPDVPSALVETAFISNPEEELKLLSKSHQNRIADVLYDSIVTHVKETIA